MNSLISNTPQVSIVTASRNLVDKLLAMNTRNRVPKEGQIRRLTEDIQSGHWELTASGIGVSRTGVLLDGQNRLLAIKAAGYPPVKFVLLTGAEDSSQRVVDRHAKRSLSDALSMFMNITVSAHMVALVNALYGFGAARDKSQDFSFSKGTLSDSAVADFMSNYGELCGEVVRVCVGCRAPVMAAVFVYALHEHDRAMEFGREVSKGANLSLDDPAFRLRASLDRLKKSSDSSGRMELFKLAVNACINHSNKKTIKLLKTADSWSSSSWNWKIKCADIFQEQS